MAAGQPYMVSAIRTRRFAITIPAVGGTPATIESLVNAVAASTDASDLSRVLGCKIDGLLTVGTARPAFTVGYDTATQLQYIGAGNDYLEPAIDEYRTAYIRSVAGAITAVVILYIG